MELHIQDILPNDVHELTLYFLGAGDVIHNNDHERKGITLPVLVQRIRPWCITIHCRDDNVMEKTQKFDFAEPRFCSTGPLLTGTRLPRGRLARTVFDACLLNTLCILHVLGTSADEIRKQARHD